MRFGETVYITDGTYTARVLFCEAESDRADLLLPDGDWYTIYAEDFYNGVSVHWYEEDDAWIIAPDWWHEI